MTVHCAKCDHAWVLPLKLPMPVDRLVKAMNGFTAAGCPECGADGKSVLLGVGESRKKHRPGKIGAWLMSGDTGTSSLTIASVFGVTRVPDGGADVPHDPDDFGRCYRLLNVMPEWRGRLSEVSAKYKAWVPLVKAWAELTALYEEELPNGTAPKLYARMQELMRRGAK